MAERGTLVASDSKEPDERELRRALAAQAIPLDRIAPDAWKRPPKPADPDPPAWLDQWPDPEPPPQPAPLIPDDQLAWWSRQRPPAMTGGEA